MFDVHFDVRKNRFGCFEGHINYFTPSGDRLGKPFCPFHKDLGFVCSDFSFRDCESVCMCFDSEGMARCSMLPDFVKHGFRSVRLVCGRWIGDGIL